MRPHRSFHDEFDFTEVEYWGSCIFAPGCEDKMDLHHVISRQRIKHRFGRGRGQIPLAGGNQLRALRDRRNLIPLCRLHHERLHNGLLRIEAEQLPEGFFDYVNAYGLQGSLPRHLAGQEGSVKGMEDTAPYSDQWVDCTGSIVDDIAVKSGDGWYPSMVQIDHYDDGCSILSTDARELAAMLVKAADSADAIDAARFATGDAAA